MNPINGVHQTEGQKSFRRAMFRTDIATKITKLVNVDPSARVRIRQEFGRVPCAIVKTREGISVHLVIVNEASEFEALCRPERFNHWTTRQIPCPTCGKPTVQEPSSFHCHACKQLWPRGHGWETAWEEKHPYSVDKLAALVVEVWERQSGRVFEAMGTENPRAQAIAEAVGKLKAAIPS